MGFRSLDDIDFANRAVVVRVDLNVPVDNGGITDTTRIDRVVPTLRELAKAGAIVSVLAHFGRPKGAPVPDMSLEPVAPALANALDLPVHFVATDWTDGLAGRAVGSASPGDVLLMENTRFHAGEEANDAQFARQLAGLGEIYVNDAFSASHRAHASTEGIARLLPSVAGRALQAELEALGQALKTPRRPLTAVVGGAKISTKLQLLGNLTGLADTLIIGGGMANTFLAAKGATVGKSLCEHDLLDTARQIMADAGDKGCTILLPADAVVTKEFATGAPSKAVDLSAVAADDLIVDAGPRAVADICAVFDASATVVWNGPLGAFEIAPFDAATVAAARHAAALTANGKLVTIAGGGDTVAALNHANVADDFTYVSTAGGAFLEWLEGKPLPGIEVLESQQEQRAAQA